MTFLEKIISVKKFFIDEEISKKFEMLSRDNLNEFGFDSFGYSPDFVKLCLPVALFFYRYYFRVESFGMENVPEGSVVLVANHSGQIPIDGALIISSMILDSKHPRMVRSMVEKWTPTLPFVSYFFVRTGQIVGTPENCRKLLNAKESILVFPEGVAGISKNYSKKYQLQEFGTGFMRLALAAKTPIVPVAVIGGEEQMPALWNWKTMADILGFPAFPITPTFPLIFPLGIVPYPVKYRLYFGDPMTFRGDPDEDDDLINKKVKLVRSSIQALIYKGLQERKHIFW
jgi:1-acyl-sn-glycerol-3-phosphate acyltransferase